MDQLKRRGWFLPNRCFLCKSEEESTNHLSLHCPKAAMFWQLIFYLFGVQWIMPYSIKETILSWHSSFVGKKRKKAWNAAKDSFILITAIEATSHLHELFPTDPAFQGGKTNKETNNSSTLVIFHTKKTSKVDLYPHQGQCWILQSQTQLKRFPDVPRTSS